MLFNSLDFLIYFPVVVAIYFMLPFRMRWIFILAASYYFYMSWNAKFLLLILTSTVIDYYTGLQMGKLESKKQRRPYMILSLVSNLGILCTFKYFNFFNESFRELFEALNIAYAIPALNVILPVGISFYTFQTLGYSLDVYHGKSKPEKHFGYFSLYVTYFPQLVAGPIERASNLLPQFRKKFDFDYLRVTDGLKLMAWGLFKKVVVADQIAPMVDYLYANPDQFGGFSIVLSNVLLSYQIYCDFSGYSDIAIGAAHIMGIQLMENFRRPFFAQSLAELWSRWHISLTSWFRDYLFIPMVRSKKFKFTWQTCIITVYVVSGLWHGANWTFILWGLITGIIIVTSRMMPKTKKFIHDLTGLGRFPKLDKVVQIFITFMIFSMLGILFRAENIHITYQLLLQLGENWGEDLRSIISNQDNSRSHILYLGYNVFEFSTTILAIVLMEFVHHIQEKHGRLRPIWAKKPMIVRWSGYVAITLLIILFSFEREIPFFYFQF